MNSLDKTYAPITTFDADSDSLVKIGEAQFWAVVKQEDLGQDVSGIAFTLEEGDLTISDEQLAALGYARLDEGSATPDQPR